MVTIMLVQNDLIDVTPTVICISASVLSEKETEEVSVTQPALHSSSVAEPLAS